MLKMTFGFCQKIVRTRKKYTKSEFGSRSMSGNPINGPDREDALCIINWRWKRNAVPVKTGIERIRDSHAISVISTFARSRNSTTRGAAPEAKSIKIPN